MVTNLATATIAGGLVSLDSVQGFQGMPPSELRGLFRETMGLTGRNFTESVDTVLVACQRQDGLHAIRETVKAYRSGDALHTRYTKRGELRVNSTRTSLTRTRNLAASENVRLAAMTELRKCIAELPETVRESATQLLSSIA